MPTMRGCKWRHFFVCMVALLLSVHGATAGTAAAAENWKGYAGPAFDGGSGTRDDPWRIATPEHLALLARAVNAGGEEYAPYRTGYYVLTGDIDLSAYEWTPIGVATFSWPAFTPVADRSFGGVFDGNGHAISGLRYASNAEVAVGLFGAVSGGWIMNVSLGADIEIPDGGGPAGRAVGGVAGLLANGIVESCDVYGTISGGTMPPAADIGSLFSLTGGVVGLNAGGHIFSSANTAAVTGASMTAVNNALAYTGGIVGQSKGEISNAFNNGPVTGGTYGASGGTKLAATGGIAGNIESGAEISESVNNGPVTGVRVGGDSDVGGIVGVLENSGVTGCINNGPVGGGDSSLLYVGGIAGSVRGDSSLLDVANTGNVSGGAASAFNFAGGVVGYNYDTGTIRNAYNFSNVAAGTGGSPKTGGVAGGNAGTIASAYWNSDLSVTGNQGAGSGIGEIAALNSTAFKSSSSFSGWSISATPGSPAGSVWFYPAYDPNRPHLASFFDADGQPLNRVVPDVLTFVVGENGARYLTLFTGDTISVISGFGFSSTPTVDGLSVLPGGQYDILRLQYANGSVAGKVDASILYHLGSQNPAYFLSPYVIRVLPVLEVGGQSRPVEQGDVLTLADPLLVPLTVVGGTGIFAPSLDSASGLTATAAADGTAIRFTGTAGTPGDYAVDIPGTVNGLPVSGRGTVTILPSDNPPAGGGILILSLNPTTATVNTRTSFAATASAPVVEASLRVTWPDGSSAAVPVSASGAALAFSLTPPQTGTAVLTFTMIGADGATSVDSVTLYIQGSGGGGGGGGGDDDGIRIVSLIPATATVDTPTAFTALTNKPVSGASLKVTYPDGSFEKVVVKASGRVLTFSFTPTRTGRALLTFTMTGTNGITSVDSVGLTVREKDGVNVLNLTPAEAVVGVTTAFAAETSRPVLKASLRATWPDGSSANIPVKVSGSTLSFSLTPPQVGLATLTFTMSEADGTMSTDALNLPVLSTTPRSCLIESVAVVPAPPYRVGDDLKITVKLTRPGSVVMYVETPRGTVEPLSVTQGGTTATAHYVPDWPGTYRLIVEASDDDEIATAVVTFRARENRTVCHNSGCDAGAFGPAALALAALALRKKKGRR